MDIIQSFYDDLAAQYDKLFFVNGSKYTDVMPDNLSQSKYNNAKKIIAKLYKEAE